MTTNPPEQFERSDDANDPLLDRLLSEAEWPRPDAGAIRRLESFVTTALADSRTNTAPAKRHSATPGRRDGLRSLMLATAITAAMVLAFVAGRWTTPDVAGGAASADNGKRPADGSNARAMRVETVQPELVPDQDAVLSRGMAADDVPYSQVPTAMDQRENLQPKPDPLTEKRSRLTQRERMRQQLDSVLACLEEDSEIDPVCCQSLMPRRAEFEFMLSEVIRSTTGQRQTAAVTAMGFVGTDGSVPMLLGSSATGDLRTAAIEAAKRCSSEQMLAGLVLQKGDASLRKEFLTELAHRSTPQAAQAWLYLVRTPASCELCLELVDELSPALIEALIAELDASLIDDRMAAILSLGRRADEQTLKRMTTLCQQFPGRWEPVAILMWNGSEPALKSLTAMQKDAERYAVLRTAAVQLESYVGKTSQVRTGIDAP